MAWNNPFRSSGREATSYFNKGMNSWKDKSNQYTGNAGYANSLNQANKGTKATQGAQVSQAAQAAQNAGMNRSMAQATARNTAATNAANVYQNQQAQAATQGNNATQAAGQQANLYTQFGEAQAKRRAGNIFGGLGSAFSWDTGSDENMKESVTLDNYKEICSKHFGKSEKPDFKSLIWTKKEGE